MAPGHCNSESLREIKLLQNFMSPADFLLHLKMEYSVELDSDVEEMVKLLDFASSYKSEVCACVVDGAAFPSRTYLFATRDIAKEQGLKNPDPIAVCLLFDYLLENFDSISGFRFVIAPHDEIKAKGCSALKIDEFDLLAISHESNHPRLIRYSDEPLPGVGFVNKNDAILFLK